MYLYDFDNPYRILAHHIVAEFRPADVLRILFDKAYLKTCILKEVRQQDMGGYFTDCIIEDILEKRDRMEYMHELDKLGEYFYSKLDKERLFSEIRLALGEMGIEVPESYSSAGGSVSSAST